MVRRSRHIRAGPRFLEFQETFKKNVRPLIGRTDRHVIETPWLTDRIADILENELDFTKSTVRQLKRRRRMRFSKR